MTVQLLRLRSASKPWLLKSPNYAAKSPICRHNLPRSENNLNNSTRAGLVSGIIPVRGCPVSDSRNFTFYTPRAIFTDSGRVLMSVNKVILVGRLGRDPETRYTGGGQAVANFSVATDETYKDKAGERQKRTEWHKIVVWGKQAEIAQQYLKKGSLIFIEGRIQSREWQDKEGQKRTSFEIVASNFRMLGGRADGAAASAGAGAMGGGAHRGGDDFDAATTHDEPAPGGSTGPEISDEDIPF